VASWELKRLISTDRPVTGAVNSTYDSRKNLWVVFGTGRLWGSEDVLPCSGWATAACESNHVQYLYGVKEGLTPEGFMDFGDLTAQASRIVDVSGARVHPSGYTEGVAPSPLLPGSEGGSTTYSSLRQLLGSPASVGYKRRLDIGNLLYPNEQHKYEMALTQPKFVPLSDGRSLVAFTTFEPRAGGCGDTGEGYLYLLGAFTGVAEPSTRNVFTPALPPGDPSSYTVPGAVVVGKGKPTEAFVVVSASGTSISSSAEDASTVSLFIPADQLPFSRQIAWREVMDTGFSLTAEQMVRDLP
jgi:Tfp pilus tip-associated adhesin PilY1